MLGFCGSLWFGWRGLDDLMEVFGFFEFYGWGGWDFWGKVWWYFVVDGVENCEWFLRVVRKIWWLVELNVYWGNDGCEFECFWMFGEVVYIFLFIYMLRLWFVKDILKCCFKIYFFFVVYFMILWCYFLFEGIYYKVDLILVESLEFYVVKIFFLNVWMLRSMYIVGEVEFFWWY